MSIPRHLIFLHGLYSSGQAFKAQFLRARYPHILTPDFTGDLGERMRALMPILAPYEDWALIGSSFGGLMAALYAARNPRRVRKLILLAPALIWPDFASQADELRIATPTTVLLRKQDEITPLKLVEPIIQRVFTTLDLRIADDDHGLRAAAQKLDWDALLA